MKLTKEEKEYLKNHIDEAVKASFSGWNFSFANKYGGKPEFPCPWNYRNIVNKYKININSLLDIGTGGGEFLSTLKPFPEKVFATESYKPNVKVAKEKLNPLGVEVIEVDNGRQENMPLPFESNKFDLVIDRHESYESKEIYRILKPGGYFITQQVGNRDLEKLRTIFGSLFCNEDEVEYTFVDFIKILKQIGFSIIKQKEHVANSRFYDIRVIVYFLKVIEWDFPDFDANKYYKRLENIFYLIKRDGYFDDICHRFYIVAQKI